MPVMGITVLPYQSRVLCSAQSMCRACVCVLRITWDEVKMGKLDVSLWTEAEIEESEKVDFLVKDGDDVGSLSKGSLSASNGLRPTSQQTLDRHHIPCGTSGQ